MKLYKISYLLLFVLIAELIYSCCDCIDTTFFDYTNCSVELNHLDNNGSETILAPSDSVSENAYGIRLSLKREEDICKLKTNSSLFFPSAYAYSCGCPPQLLYLPLDSIHSVTIFTINPFDASHEANSDVTAYFKVFRGNKFNTIYDYLDNYVSNSYEFVISDDDYIEYLTLAFDLLLITPPTIGTDHQFKVIIELSDGRILEEQTTPVKLI